MTVDPPDDVKSALDGFRHPLINYMTVSLTPSVSDCSWQLKDDNRRTFATGKAYSMDEAYAAARAELVSFLSKRK